MADKQLSLNLEIGTAKATKSLKDAAKEAKKLGTELEDTRTAGKKLADSIGAVADEMESEFKQATKAATKLEQALGEDGVAAIKKQGKSIDELVQDLKRAGLAYDDIEADVDELAASIKRMSDVGDQIDTHITKNMEGVARSTDQSRSVMANFAGNAAQELPGVAGAFGPLNMAISQFVEYGAEGNISLMSLAKLAGPMLGVGLAIGTVSARLEEVAKTKAWHTERVKKFVDLLNEGKDAAAALEETLDQEDHNPLQWMKHGEVQDLTDELIRNKVTWAELKTHINDSEEAFHQWASARFASANGAEDLNHALNWQMQAHDDLAAATTRSAGELFVFGKATSDVGDDADKTARQIQYLESRFQSMLGVLDDEDAYENALDGFDSVGQAAEDAYLAAATGAEDADAKSRDYQQSVRDLKRTVVDYAEELGNVPTDVVSEVITLIDQGKFDEARAKVDTWANTPAYKKVYVTTKTPGAVPTVSGGMKGFAKGGRTPGGTVLVGEDGPELVDLPAGSTVHTASETRNMGNGPNITIFAPSQSPESLYAAIERYKGRNGL